MAKLSAEMTERVRELAHLVRTQDNRITADPIFMVQKQVREWGIAEGYEEGATWCDDEGPEADPKVLKALRGRGVEFGTERELNGHTYRRIAYRDRWENVQPFLTEAGANEYLRINGHNLGKTQIYVESAYRNAEWQFMRELILAMAPEEVSRG